MGNESSSGGGNYGGGNYGGHSFPSASSRPPTISPNSHSGNYGGHSSFSSSFAAAARDLGPGKTFSYNGKSYSTNRADGRDMRISSTISASSRPATISASSRPPTISHTSHSNNYGGHSSFSSSFAAASRDLGPGKTFSYGGKSYSTNRASSHAPISSASSDLLKKSNDSAKFHMKPMGKYESSIKSASKKHGIPESVIKGVISRESGAGTLLGKNGNKPGWGDNNNAFGLMQIDKRHHTIKNGNINNIDEGTKILANNLKAVQKKHPGWTKEQQLQGAVAAYNFGTKNVQTWKNLDKGTAGNNYSQDVMNRAKCFEEKQ